MSCEFTESMLKILESVDDSSLYLFSHSMPCKSKSVEL